MTELQPTMLWESTDAPLALRQRFRFDSAAAVVEWLTTTLATTYAIPVQAVDRLVISDANLLAWISTADGFLFAKCCALPGRHVRLATIADLLCWLDAQGLPVSVPLPSVEGARQVRCDHLTVGLQRLIPGQLLDPTDLVQAQAAGVILARLHQALARYPDAAALAVAAPQAPSLQLDERILAWAKVYVTRTNSQALMADCHALTANLTTATLPLLPPQLVHSDYRAANLLWHEGALSAVLDFEELSWGHRVNDLAWAAVHLGTRFHHWRPVAPVVHEAFRTGYESLQPLTAAEADWFPLLMRWHGLNLAATMAHQGE